MVLIDMLRNAAYGPKTVVQPGKQVEQPVLDSAANAPEKATFDSAEGYELSAIAQQAVAAIHQWVETSDLDAGETMADRLMSLFVGIADANKDGELDDDEQEIVEAALNAAWDYLESMGVDESDISALLNDWDDAVANNVIDLVATTLPEGEDAADQMISTFAFGDDEQGAVFDATYAKRIVVRDGKKVRVNKRIAGTVRLSAKQKVAIRKMQAKSHSAKARAGRLRSFKARKSMSI